MKLLGKHGTCIVVSFLLIGLAPFYWLRNGIPLLFWNGAFHGLFFPGVFSDARYVWDYAISTGRSMAHYFPTFFPIFLLNKFLENIPFNIAFIQAMVLSGLILASLFAMYFFMLELFTNRKNKEQIGFFASLFYCLNFFSLFYIFYRDTYYIYMLPFIPLFLYFLLRASRTESFFYSFLVSATAMIFSVAFFNPSFGSLILLIGVLFYSMVGGIRKLKTIYLMVLLFFSLNSFWILPSFTYLYEGYQETSLRSPTKANFDVTTLSTDILAAFRLIPKKTLWLYKIKDTSWSDVYFHNSFFVFISVLAPIIAFTSLLEKNRSLKKIIIFFSFLAIAGIFLSKGGNEPFGFINKYLILELPFMRLYAGPDKFSFLIMLAYSILFGYGANFISEFAHKHKILSSRLASVILISLLLINAFPFWTGWIITTNVTFGDANVTSFTKIPDHYYELKNFFNGDDEDYRLVFLPLLPFDMPTFNWKYGYIGDDIRKNLFNKPVFSVRAYEGTWDKATLLLSKSIESDNREEKESFKKVLGLLNVKYVVLHFDVNLTHGNYLGQKLRSPWELKNFISKNNFSHVKSLRDIEVYKIPKEYFLPRIYSASIYILIDGGINEIFPVIASDNFTVGNFVLFLSNQLSSSQIHFIKGLGTTVFIPREDVVVPVYDGWVKPFNWSLLESRGIEARFYAGWKLVIRTDGKEKENTLSFSSLEECPYEFPSFSKGSWAAHYSTIVYIKTGPEPLKIDVIYEDGKPVNDVLGVWWETDWVGMIIKKVRYPFIIPPNQKAIIQINHIVKGNITLSHLNLVDLSKLSERNISPTVTFQRINPTKYIVNVSASNPYFLIFSESYHKNWIAYVDGRQVPNEYHFMANGFANAWYINKTGTYTITLEFWPQKLFYIGSAISITTLILCTLYITKNKIKITYKRYIKKIHV